MIAVTRKIHVIGINSFEFKDLPPKLQNLFIETNNIAVPVSYFPNIKSWVENNNNKNKKLFFVSNSDNKLIDWLKSQETDVILISRGDPLWFGIGRILLENFSKNELIFYPSNTSIQLAFSKMKIPWQEINTISIHGRDTTKFIEALRSKPNVLGVLTNSKNNDLEIIRKNLLELNLHNLYEFWVCEEIGFKNEKLRKLNINETLPTNISKLNVVVLLKIDREKIDRQMPLFGLIDEAFKTYEDRPNLLTKREIRIQILADLELPMHGVIWDIGAGCGSIGLEALRLRPNLDLFCIDKRIGSKALILENAKRLGVIPKDVFEEDINNILNSKKFNYFKNANRVIIGGCDKRTKILIINALSKTMRIGDIVIIPIVDIQSLKVLREELEEKKFKTSLNLIQTYKSLSIADGIRLDPNNPIFIIKGKK